MAITLADWALATDPFILALAHSYSSSTSDFINNHIIIHDSVGYLSAFANDRDTQEVFWSKDADREITWFVSAVQKLVDPGLLLKEVGKYQENTGTSFSLYKAQDIYLTDPAALRVYTAGKSSGSVVYSLFAYTAYTWMKKDPAQVLFSWIAHHVASQFTLKDFINQASFQAASDYYDENPIELSLTREVGSSISEQIKKVMDHTSDFISIRPADSDGKMQLHISPRLLGGTVRTTAIDLDSKSVEDYVIRPTDKYTIDRLDIDFGALFFIKDSSYPSGAGDYITTKHPEIPGVNRATLSQKVGPAGADVNVVIDAPYHLSRGSAYNHLDIDPWLEDQDEVEIDFADWSHMNFEDGDIVPLTGGKANYSGELFLVTEKTRDLDTMLASARFLRIKTPVGKRPRYADKDNLLCSLVPNTLGDFFEVNQSYPMDVFKEEDPRNKDRGWDVSNGNAHISEGIRVNPLGLLQVDAEVRGRLPGIINDGTAVGQFPDYGTNEFSGLNTAATTDMTVYFVINQDAANLNQTNFLFHQIGIYQLELMQGHPTAAQTVRFYDGVTTQGTKLAIGGWQILVYVLDSTGATIRRNGADLETGLPYSKVQLVSDNTPGHYQALLANSYFATNSFKGDFMEFHLFDTIHNSTTIDEIEEYLADKYDITI